MLYNVFVRTWWVKNPAWPGGREPGAGKRRYIKRRVELTEARSLCSEYNSTHNPGFLSKKAEFESL